MPQALGEANVVSGGQVLLVNHLLCSLKGSSCSVFITRKALERLAIFEVKSPFGDKLSLFWEIESLFWVAIITFLG